MKLTFWQCFKMSLAISAGYEVGRMLPRVAYDLTKKRFRDEVKEQYKRRMAAVPEEDRVRVGNFGIRSVMTEDERNRTTETPTGE